MSLVNSFVNQIGREIGHDVYRSIQTNSKNQILNIDFNSSFIEEIKQFELKNSEDITINKLINLIEKSENVNANTLNWQECFIEIDNKIEFCKENLNESNQTKLNELDEKNIFNFKLKKTEHITFIEGKLIEINTEFGKVKSKNIYYAIVFSLLGLNPFFYNKSIFKKISHFVFFILSIYFIYYGTMLKSKPKLYHGNIKIESSLDIEKIVSLGESMLYLGVFIYSILIFSSIIRIRKNIKKINSIEKNHSIFQVYNNELTSTI